MKSVSVLLFATTVWLASAEELGAFVGKGSFKYRSDYEYNQEAGGWLKFHRVPATFTDAFLRCKAEGSTVASPLTVDLQNAMIGLAKDSDPGGIFTGVHAVFSKGDFATVEGVPLYKLPVKWAPGKPDNHKNSEDCTIMLENGTLADVRCDDFYPYICYKKWTGIPLIKDVCGNKELKELIKILTAIRHSKNDKKTKKDIKNIEYRSDGQSVTPLMTPCGTVDQGYVLDTRTGSCYKFHNVGLTWRRAYMTCMAEGGYLAVINSPAEVEVNLSLKLAIQSSTKANRTT